MLLSCINMVTDFPVMQHTDFLKVKTVMKSHRTGIGRFQVHFCRNGHLHVGMGNHPS